VNAVPALSHPSTAPIALFDANHGQPNWAQTGFTSRQLDTNFAGITERLCRLGFCCQATHGEPLVNSLADTRLLVIPPPAGRYDSRKEQWRPLATSLFTVVEVRRVLAFLRGGGRLLAFGYRFGDSFTHTNLGDLLTPLGCRLNDDAVINAGALRRTHPLKMHFDTPAEFLPLSWSRAKVAHVCWRPCATFTIAPGANAWPLAFSTGGQCLSFDRTLRRICFESLPIAVVGHYGAGRFALFGGPHLFEFSQLGLLQHGDNAHFLENILRWVLENGTEALLPAPESIELVRGAADHALTCVNGRGEGESTIASVERVLRKTGVLKALNRAKWLP
jgi:hypothetical protein